MRRKDREITDIHEIESLIGRMDVCRIGLTDGLVPYIVTMNFGYKGGNPALLYFHCAPEGRKIEMIRRNSFVCFQMDTDHNLKTGEKACDYGMSYSSILGHGNIFIVNEEAEKRSGMNFIMDHYSQNNMHSYNPEIFKRTTILRLEISEMSCKKR